VGIIDEPPPKPSVPPAATFRPPTESKPLTLSVPPSPTFTPLVTASVPAEVISTVPPAASRAIFSEPAAVPLTSAETVAVPELTTISLSAIGAIQFVPPSLVQSAPAQSSISLVRHTIVAGSVTTISYPIRSSARRSESVTAKICPYSMAGSIMADTAPKVTALSFQWLACRPSPPCSPVDIGISSFESRAGAIWSKLHSIPGIRQRGKVSNSAAVSGSLAVPFSKRNTSSVVGYTVTVSVGLPSRSI